MGGGGSVNVSILSVYPIISNIKVINEEMTLVVSVLDIRIPNQGQGMGVELLP